MSRLVILLSEKSSGSSIFQQELARHRDVRTVAWTPHNESETLYWVKAACELGYPDAAFWAGKPPFPRKYCRKSMQALLDRNLDRRIALDGSWERICDGWTALVDRFGPVLFEKSPHHLNQWPALACLHRFIAGTDRDVRVIALVRNPLSVVYSTYQRWHSQADERQFMWEQSYRNLLAFRALIPPERFLLVRYEDLIRSPAEGFAQVQRFMGLDPDPAVGQGVHANSLDKWQHDERFSFRIDPAVMQLATHFGYSPEQMTCLREHPHRVNAMVSVPKRIVFLARSRLAFYRNHVWR